MVYIKQRKLQLFLSLNQKKKLKQYLHLRLLQQLFIDMEEQIQEI